jgi:hypothetical protein
LDFLLGVRRGRQCRLGRQSRQCRLGVGLWGKCPGASPEEKSPEKKSPEEKSETGSFDFSLEGCLDLGHGVAQPLLRVG